jgi:hypothetical protein
MGTTENTARGVAEQSHPANCGVTTNKYARIITTELDLDSQQQIMRSNNWKERRALAENPWVATSILNLLRNDNVEEVRNAARYKLGSFTRIA